MVEGVRFRREKRYLVKVDMATVDFLSMAVAVVVVVEEDAAVELVVVVVLVENEEVLVLLLMLVFVEVKDGTSPFFIFFLSSVVVD